MQTCLEQLCGMHTLKVGVRLIDWLLWFLQEARSGKHWILDQSTKLTILRLDDKLFSFWLLQDENYPFSHIKGVYRFETGIKVNEFRDLRANPRYESFLSCILTLTCL